MECPSPCPTAAASCPPANCLQVPRQRPWRSRWRAAPPIPRHTGSVDSSPQQLTQMTPDQLQAAADSLGDAYTRNSRGPQRGDALCQRAADDRPHRPVAGGDAQTRHLPTPRTARSWPPMARRWRPTASSSRRSTRCGGRRRRNIRTGGCFRPRAPSSTSSARRTRRARSTARRCDIQPNEPSILSNLGMSYVLTGDLHDRRNLSAQGRRRARRRQPRAPEPGAGGGPSGPLSRRPSRSPARNFRPQQAQANVAYLRQMLSQQNAWSQLKERQWQGRYGTGQNGRLK